ncbi:class II D-tagatose-bisphosphate aldolase non-catalytic subunit [Bauldia sp.]|uniref:class II D-tagatose-bisphosphate aldolase non-catalytic subunit n=1 Tax=Bauldia sp. TaxID=2575872 RepID=UPI003BAB78CE
MQSLRTLIEQNRAGAPVAIPSVCSAHPEVLVASLLLARSLGRRLLVEATSNQVNQFGGYTRMEPADFIAFVHHLADDHDVPREMIDFGGDHLGPQAWRDEPADMAMAKAADLVRAYVTAGFTKIHLDCSEGCAGEAGQVGDAVAAARAAELAAVCEDAALDGRAISYVVGTEVPSPGGVRAEEGDHDIAPTDPDAARATITTHRDAFTARGLEAAWSRVAGLVVQPGLEFGATEVFPFPMDSPNRLSAALADTPGLCFEAHSTDYQAPAVFPELARRNFAILKVGPALTFAYRQAVYALAAIDGWLHPTADGPHLPAVMERLMTADPGYWQRHYAGDGEALRLQRHFAYADRIRYYWAQPAAREAVTALMARLTGPRPLPPLLEQYVEPVVLDRADGLIGDRIGWARAIVLAQVQGALAPYFFF